MVRLEASHAVHAALAAALSVWCLAAHGEPLPSPLSNADIPRIVSFGPWPPPSGRDASNRVSGRPAAIAFGEALFNDRHLSRDGKVSCASCHQPTGGFADGRPTARGMAHGDRNTLGLANLAQQRWFGWDGANDNLWAQSLRPMVDAREMGGSIAQVAKAVREQLALRRGYTTVFGKPPGKNDERVAIDVAKALAAYQETLVTPRTPFDDFRDAVQRGDRAGAAAYPQAAQRGLALFIGDGRCYVCHSGPGFSNGEFHDIGIPHFVAPGRVDAGRHGGIKSLRASRYNLLGAFNDDTTRGSAIATRHVELQHRNFGEFKVPGLRNLARTAPYMHNGSKATLRDVLLHYSDLPEVRLHADGEKLLVPLRLKPAQIEDLLAFLDSLNTPSPSPSASHSHSLSHLPSEPNR
ncbi:MAG: cytochrome c peroxidase [Rubrivivax sp.]